MPSGAKLLALSPALLLGAGGLIVTASGLRRRAWMPIVAGLLGLVTAYLEYVALPFLVMLAGLSDMT